MKTFLTAHWKNVILFTYAVSPEILVPHLPKGIELDTKDGQAFLSLVAFEFLNTRVKGIKIPFHVNFPEINLRFYVHKNGKRGVVFIKELVPRYMIAKVARKIYNEPYEAVKMKCNTVIKENEQHILHQFWIDKKEFAISVVTQKEALPPPPETSIEHFFKEHDMGYGTSHKGNTLSYQVHHPYWEVYSLISAEHNVDFGVVYGEKWNFLNTQKPYHVMVAKGSDIKVCEYTE